MSYEGIRALLAHSPTGYAEVVIGNPNKIWPELRLLLKERDRAVELLKKASDSMMSWYSECDAYCVGEMDEQSREIDAFLRGLEGE